PSPGAGHGAEIQFVFGTLGTFHGSAKGFTDADRATAANLGRYWTDFAKAGDPNGTGLPSWAEDKGDHVLVIDESGPHTVDGLRKVRLDLMALTKNTH
ncbi:MAG: carboxylesterase family protein, partial [Pseudomonadota bacterium]|nr:carboxylesterase family protein [Pseudomonadota bacterium]